VCVISVCVCVCVCVCGVCEGHMEEMSSLNTVKSLNTVPERIRITLVMTISCRHRPSSCCVTI
jgi:hypothetical protein